MVAPSCAVTFLTPYVQGRRSPAGILFLVANRWRDSAVLATLFGRTLWIAYVALALIGGLIYGPVMLIGLQAIDLSPRMLRVPLRASPACSVTRWVQLWLLLVSALLLTTGVGALHSSS